MKIDSHPHFWIYDPVRDKWINDSMGVIKNNFLPYDLKPHLDRNNMDGCMAVQASQNEEETHFLLGLAEQYDFIKGVVGWVDLRNENIGERLEYYSQFKTLKGFRHIVQGEQADDFLLREDFCKGVALLKKYDFTYDILIYPKHLKYAAEFVRRFPDQKFVIDHLAKPDIKNHSIKDWQRDLKPFAQWKNVSCKISELVTEADWQGWKSDDFSDYISVTLEIFGPERVMFGSDWPVCLLAASYDQICEIVQENISFLNDEEKNMLWGLNCSRFYSR